jgi:hypothetical protein
MITKCERKSYAKKSGRERWLKGGKEREEKILSQETFK